MSQQSNTMHASKLTPMTNLIELITSLRTVRIWVDGYERSGIGAYRRTPGEVIYAVQLVRYWQ